MKTTSYTPAEISSIADGLRAGLSASQIARKLDGVTKNAIIGIVHRHHELKAIGFARKVGQNEVPKPNLAKPRVINVKASKPLAVPNPVIALAPEPVIDDALDDQNGVTLMARKDNGCCVPLSKRDDMGLQLYCERVAKNGNYCAGHHAKYTMRNPYRKAVVQGRVAAIAEMLR